MLLTVSTMMKPRILIVDDQPNLARILRLTLESDDEFEVREVIHSLNVAEAVRTFRPDLVVLDVEMPWKNGAEIARELTRDAGVPCSSIIFLSGLIAPHESGVKHTPTGPMRFLSKMAGPEVLRLTVREVLSVLEAAA